MGWKNDEEKTALGKKLRNPELDVNCPTCAHALKHSVVGNSELAECPKCGSFVAARGI